ncbi:polysaccharide biosynthesis/export family protein [Sphingobacterium composti Ten et al. 2007 non Yoo et al. 2007]|uniref:polysaccharide biosynthesis/export family protein n=1 Tax=Sphingobacterium composti TaxID=363260 RepID=UPI001358FBB4|nr:polysaccharide biosynthesis/export family protein [Sphingobacterium composti Ten et al. 2007 non Yoo et al. 2007]
MKKISLFIGIIIIVFLGSCGMSEKVVYLKDLEPNTSYNVVPIPPLRIQKSDRISIQVSAKNQELAAPFNNRDGVYSISEDGITNPVLIDRGYLVDQQGNIEFPILGTLKIEGMTLEGLRDYIKDQLSTKNLLSSPVVKIELLNLKVVVMGETGNKIITAPDSRLTILEAITMAGGLTPNSQPHNIAVIREEDGQRKIYHNNIESKDIFNSPTYYLQQNDLLYIEPKSAPRTIKQQQNRLILTTVLSLVSTITSVWAITTR